MRPWLHSSHWSPISLVPQCNPVYTVLIGPPSHWSPNVTLVIQFSFGPPSHWSPQCNSGYTVLIGPPSHWSPSLTFLHCSHWSPVSLVPQCNPGYKVLIGPVSHWSPMRLWLHNSHWSPIPLVPHCNPFYPVLIGPPSHWSPNVTLSTLFSLVPHLIGAPMWPWLHSSHWCSISLVTPCNPSYPALTGPPSHWSHFGTQRVGPIHTLNIGPIDEGFISISAMESHP